MANEITIAHSLMVTNGDLRINNPTVTKRFTQTTARGGGPGTIDVGTTEETISFGDTVPGWVEMRNLDTVNFVEVGFSTGVYGIRLVANGGVALFYRNGSATVYAKSDTAGCKVQVTAVNV